MNPPNFFILLCQVKKFNTSSSISPRTDLFKIGLFCYTNSALLLHSGLARRSEQCERRRGLAQLVARMVWDHEAVGSSPTSPTLC